MGNCAARFGLAHLSAAADCGACAADCAVCRSAVGQHCTLAVVLSLACAAIFGTVSAIILAFRSGFVAGIALPGACAVCAGLAILLFIGTKRATKALFHLAKAITIRIKKAHQNKKEE